MYQICPFFNYFLYYFLYIRTEIIQEKGDIYGHILYILFNIYTLYIITYIQYILYKNFLSGFIVFYISD